MGGVLSRERFPIIFRRILSPAIQSSEAPRKRRHPNDRSTSNSSASARCVSQRRLFLRKSRIRPLFPRSASSLFFASNLITKLHENIRSKKDAIKTRFKIAIETTIIQSQGNRVATTTPPAPKTTLFPSFFPLGDIMVLIVLNCRAQRALFALYQVSVSP